LARASLAVSVVMIGLLWESVRKNALIVKLLTILGYTDRSCAGHRKVDPAVSAF
jgi:hypothetical protein